MKNGKKCVGGIMETQPTPWARLQENRISKPATTQGPNVQRFN